VHLDGGDRSARFEFSFWHNGVSLLDVIPDQSVWYGPYSSVADGVKYLPEQAVIMIHFPRGKSVAIPVEQISELDDVPADALSSIALSFAGKALTLMEHNIGISVQGLLESRQGKDGSGSPEDRFNGNAAKHVG